MLASRVNIGELDRRVTIQRKTTERDAFNQPTITSWETLFTVWAKVDEAPGNETYESDQLTAVRLTRFTIRYRDGISEQDRIAFDERFYDIVSITKPDRKRTLQLKAKLLDET